MQVVKAQELSLHQDRVAIAGCRSFPGYGEPRTSPHRASKAVQLEVGCNRNFHSLHNVGSFEEAGARLETATS